MSQRWYNRRNMLLQEEYDRYVRRVHIPEDKKKRTRDIRKVQERVAGKVHKEKFLELGR